MGGLLTSARRQLRELSIKGFQPRQGFCSLAAFGAALLLTGCMQLQFITQAAAGQWELYTSGRPLSEVIADSKTAPRTRELLQEIVRIKRYGQAVGLDMHKNYERYVELDRKYVVWFVNASEPLAFTPKTFWFPVVGSFPGLGWFDERAAQDFAETLKQEGWDVNVRGISAFSTGGWFDDPVLSSMLTEHPAALGFLVNVVLHESVHATVLVEDQQYFNESLASFIADQLTPEYLVQHFGESSDELLQYATAREQGRKHGLAMAEAYQALERLYRSPLSDADKTREKARLLRELAAQVPFETPPNNATLIGFQLYREGYPEQARLREACGAWSRYVQAVASLGKADFAEPQSPDIGPVFERLTQRRCEPLPERPVQLFNPQIREQRHRQRAKQAAL